MANVTQQEIEAMTVENTIRIGTVVGFHGLRGDVKVRPENALPDWPGVVKQVLLTVPDAKASNKLRLEIRSLKKTKWNGKSVLVQIEGYPDRTAVEELKGSELRCLRSMLPVPDEEEYFADDLRGLSVLDESGKKLGEVKGLISSTGQDFLDIHFEASESVETVPFNHHFFPDINLEDGLITIANLKGFLPDD